MAKLLMKFSQTSAEKTSSSHPPWMRELPQADEAPAAQASWRRPQPQVDEAPASNSWWMRKSGDRKSGDDTGSYSGYSSTAPQFGKYMMPDQRQNDDSGNYSGYLSTPPNPFGKDHAMGSGRGETFSTPVSAPVEPAEPEIELTHEEVVQRLQAAEDRALSENDASSFLRELQALSDYIP